MSDGWKWKWFDENGIGKKVKSIVAKHALGTRDQEATMSKVGEIGKMDENGNDLMKME